MATLYGIAVMLAADTGAARQALLAVRAPAATSATAVTFSDVTAAAGIDFTHVNGASPQKFLAETMGSGALLFDYDQDGWLDIFLVDGGSFADRALAARARHRLYRNRGDGSFEDRTAVAGIRHRAFGMGACAGDIDNDGWVDLHISNVGSNLLYRNNGNGTFVDISKPAGMTASVWSASCAFADIDRDGDLDLFVTSYVDATATKNPPCADARLILRVYCHPLVFNSLASVLHRNDGSGRFTDISIPTGIAAYKSNGLGVVVSDVDEDGWPDIFVANDGLPNHLFHNTGKGSLRRMGCWRASPWPATAGRERAWAPTPATTMRTDISISSSPICGPRRTASFAILVAVSSDTPRPKVASVRPRCRSSVSERPFSTTTTTACSTSPSSTATSSTTRPRRGPAARTPSGGCSSEA